MKMKNDKYRRARGGSAQMLDISCAVCGAYLMLYQKDGPGNLLRCYLNRIFAPPELEALQHNPSIDEPRDLSPLVCRACGTAIGTPMRYDDGRLAFRLHHGSFAKRKSRGVFR